MATLEAEVQLSLRMLRESLEARKAEARGIRARLREREVELAAARRELARATRDGGAACGVGGEPVVSAAADDHFIFHYVLDGRAGKMSIPPDGVLDVDETIGPNDGVV